MWLVVEFTLFLFVSLTETVICRGFYHPSFELLILTRVVGTSPGAKDAHTQVQFSIFSSPSMYVFELCPVKTPKSHQELN